jgi:integrase
VRSKSDAIALPEYVYRVRYRGEWLYYYQHRRGSPDRGPNIRLPEPNSPEWFEAVASAKKALSKPIGVTMKTVWFAYVNGPRKPMSEGTLRTYASAWKIIKDAWGDLHPRQVTAPAIGKLHDGLAEDRRPMANMVLVVIKHLMEEAHRAGLISTIPTLGMRPHRRGKVDSAKPLTQEAWDALMSPECPAQVYRLAILQRATGQRISDVVRMTPSMRLRDGISHPIKKTKHAEFWSYIDSKYLIIIDSWECFPNTPYCSTPKLSDEQSLRHEWNKFAATEAGAALRGFTSHDLRATNYCDHILAGKDKEEIARMRGTSEHHVTHYTKHLGTETFVKTVKKRSNRS